MLKENNISHAAIVIGSTFLCATSLKELTKNILEINKSIYIALPLYLNCFILGFSTGAFIVTTRHILYKNE